MNQIEILNLITEKAEIGISEKDISDQIPMKTREVRTGIRSLYNQRLIFRNLSTNRWKLRKYKTTELGYANKDLEWTAS